MNYLNAVKELKWRQDFPGGPVLRLCAPTAGGMGLILGQGTKTPHATQQSQIKFFKKFLNK